MTNEKKIAYQQKHIEELEAEIVKLNEYIKSVEDDAESKEAFYQKQLDILAEKTQKVDATQNHFNELVSELEEIKKKYIDTLSEMADFRKNFEKEFKSALKGITKKHKELIK
jgi:uncharacterized coiled-coil protein SlyX